MTWADWKAAFIADNDQTGKYILTGIGSCLSRDDHTWIIAGFIPVKDGTYTLDTGYLLTQTDPVVIAHQNLAEGPITLVVEHGRFTITSGFTAIYNKPLWYTPYRISVTDFSDTDPQVS